MLSRNIGIVRTADVGGLGEDVAEDAFVLPAFAFCTGSLRTTAGAK